MTAPGSTTGDDLAAAKPGAVLAGADGQAGYATDDAPAVPAAAVDGDGSVPGVDERKLLRKLDLHIIPLVMLLYTFSFLDRVNIGNARLYNLEKDLGLVGNQYQIAVSILFITYLLMEIPSNLALKPLTPQRWIAFIAFSWGIVATLTGLVRNYGELLAVRLILGALEAGLFPGLNVYLTFFYTKRELALRVGYLFVSAAVAGALGGLLAYGIGQMDGIQGMSGWRWIMIIEGIPSVLLGVVTLFYLPNDPQHAYFLTPEEKRFMVFRARRGYGDTASAQEFDRKDMIAAFKDWKVWTFAVAQFGADTMLYGYSTFLPTIIRGLGTWTTAQIQLLTIPCYFVGAVTYMTVAWLSDRKQMRGMFCVIFGTVSAAGYAVLLSDTSAGVHYFGAILVAMGLYVLVGLPLAWLPNNSPRYGKRTTANGLQLTCGNASGIMTPFIYLSQYAPRYVLGNAVSLAMVGMATGLYGGLWFHYDRQNKARAAGLVKPEHANLSEEELAELGDESPAYRYTI
ncbi:MFS transporter ACS family allantoate permease [Microdochium nivale]|nr:MFS transporter ACS family allantoate permease [Microdochium nivale]